MRQQKDRFEQLGVRVKVVTFDANYMALAYVQSTNMKWPLLVDEDRVLYAAYGMERASWWALMSPLQILKYVRVILRGTRLGKPGKDVRQMGGDVLIDPQGIVRLHHVSLNPNDRPPVESIFDLIESHV